ncbi:peptidylprolyl isomerase, partial [Candidatus Marinimicrobia bacterium]|nr:peptidylprolyl isomerase [Candidatus Neomarinimicrobiota bacterium]
MNYYYKLFLFTLVSFSFAQKEANKTNDEAEDLSSQKHIQSIDGVAAIVGDKLVLTSDVNQALAMEIFKQKLDPQRDQLKILELKNKIIESIVSRKVVLAMAELDSVEVGEKDVDRALNQQVDNIISQAGSEKAAEKALGQPLRTFKREYWYDVRDMLITQKYQQTLIGRVSINKTGVERFFNAFRDSLPLFPTTVKLRHLLIKINPGEKQINKTTALLLDLRKKLLNKKLSFKDAALTYSQDPGSKNTGGSLGFVRRGTLVTAFEAVAFNLKPGEVSLPIKTEFGYHIIET